MKFALLFLFALVVISHQQFQPRMHWMPYSRPYVLDNYQSDYYNNVEDQIPIFRYFRPSIPVDDRNQEIYPNAMIFGSQNNNEDDFQSRNKGLSRYRPFNLNQRPAGRFFFNLGSGGGNFLFKTATFTSTSTVTVATIVNCVPTEQVSGSPSTCRRRRSDADLSETEDTQFSVSPSEPELLMATVRPSTSQLRKNSQLATDESAFGLRSSKEDEIILPTNTAVVTLDKISREKRFFNLATTTVITYSFVSTNVTKTVNLGTPAVAPAPGTGSVLCLPAGYIICI